MRDHTFDIQWTDADVTATCSCGKFQLHLGGYRDIQDAHLAVSNLCLLHLENPDGWKVRR